MGKREWAQRGIKYNKMILQQATMRLGMYQPVVAGLPIFLYMATQL